MPRAFRRTGCVNAPRLGSRIDRLVQKLGRGLCEVSVGFRWFTPGLFDGSYCFGGEEGAGASFLHRNRREWTTDKAGPLMDLIVAEHHEKVQYPFCVICI